MKKSAVRLTSWLGIMGLASVSLFLTGCGGGGNSTPAPVGTTRFVQTNLVSDLPNVAAVTDPNLVNPWGIAFSPTGPFWIADNNSGKSTLYDGSGAIQSLVVNIPAPGASTGGTASGQVFNGTSSFTLFSGQPALFIFSTEDGTIVGWYPANGTQAVVAADQSAVPAAGAGAVYKGLAIGASAGANFLYAANFRTGTIDVFDTNFHITHLAGSFTDPGLPAGFAPFGIQNIRGNLYVTYARQDAQKHDDVEGAGSGLINVFDTSGNFIRRFATGSAAGGTVTTLNSPWGLAAAPASFGRFSNALLVGNFGDGHITAFDRTTGASLGQVQDTTGTNPIVIPGLWGLEFGNGGSAGSLNVLYFTAGIGDTPTSANNKEMHGLFGSLQPAP